jgi:DNA-binding transcriptional ArsR family regulator
MSGPDTPEKVAAGTRVIDNAETIKALADPLRMRILHLMMLSTDRTWSVKEVASELTQPVTKLYHHVKLLEAADLISDVESRVVSGIVEHRYRANQRSLRFDFGPGEDRHESIEQVAAMIDAVRDDLVDYLYRDEADDSNVTISRSVSRLTDDEIAELNRTFDALTEKWAKHRDDPKRAHVPRTSVLLLVSPLGHDPG